VATIVKRIDSKGAVSWQVKIRLRGHAPLSLTFSRKGDARAWSAEMETTIRRGRAAIALAQASADLTRRVAEARSESTLNPGKSK